MAIAVAVHGSRRSAQEALDGPRPLPHRPRGRSRLTPPGRDDRRPMRRLRLAVALTALGIASAVVVSWTRGVDTTGRYITSPVDRGPITARVTATGTVNPVKTVQVGTYVSGPIQEIAVDFNTLVQRGQLLAKIDPRPFQMKVDAAVAALANARA